MLREGFTLFEMCTLNFFRQCQRTALPACESELLFSRKMCLHGIQCCKLYKMKDKADPALVYIGQLCIASSHSQNESSSPLRLFPPYPRPLMRCIQANSSRVRSIGMTVSVLGLQLHGIFPIGASAERLAISYPLPCHDLRRMLHLHDPSDTYTGDFGHRVLQPTCKQWLSTSCDYLKL